MLYPVRGGKMLVEFRQHLLAPNLNHNVVVQEVVVFVGDRGNPVLGCGWF